MWQALVWQCSTFQWHRKLNICVSAFALAYLTYSDLDKGHFHSVISKVGFWSFAWKQLSPGSCKGVAAEQAPNHYLNQWWPRHYSDVIMGVMASQITSLAIVYPIVYSGSDKRIHQSSASLAFERGIHRWPVNSPHKGAVTRKMFPFDDVIMASGAIWCHYATISQRYLELVFP